MRIAKIRRILSLSTRPDVGAKAADAYARLAREMGMEPAQLALAWAMSRPFMSSVIIGATTPEQLDVNLAAADISLSDTTMDAIAALHREFPMPM